MIKSFNHDGLFTTLVEARQWVHDNRDFGVICPCCGQFAKLYKRKFNSGMARCLIEIYRMTKRGDIWIDLARMLNPSITYNREWGKLPYWGVIGTRDAPPTPGRAHNEYRLTTIGHDFVENRIRIARRVWVYNATPLALDADTIDIVEALGNKFDYWELMNGI